MKTFFVHMFAFVAAMTTTAFADENLPATLMTTRGKLLVDQNFSGPLPPLTGKPVGFASGFQGWRYNVGPRGGNWEVVEGTFLGKENVEVSHPATASYGFDFQNVVIQCELCLDDVPLDGRKFRYMMVRTTDEKDYVCSVHLSQNGLRIQKDDNDHAGPDKLEPLGMVKQPVKLGQWQTVVFEIQGDEMVGTLNGQSVTGTHPLIASPKHSVMFVIGNQGRVRNFKVWEALPNPQWEQNRRKLQAETPPPASAKAGS